MSKTNVLMRVRTATVALAATLLAAGCGGASPLDFGGDGGTAELTCSIPQAAIESGQRKDGIPALTNPELTEANGTDIDYLREQDLVVGVILDGQPIAVPLNILWWHEVVNLDGAERSIVVTHCPLTGSSLVFDRGPVNGAEFGVSGLLYQTNLIMYDRSGAQESLWPQMLRGARCGVKDGQALPMVASIESSWKGWVELHPSTKVLTSNTGWDRDYRLYPYGTYDRPDNGQLYFGIQSPIDRRRPPKERVLGIPDGGGGLALPYGELDELGAVAAVHAEVGGSDVVVLWERSRNGAMAYRPAAAGQSLTFEVVDGRIIDTQTGSWWRLDGRAISGPLNGESLEPVDEAFVAFWFAWPAFYSAIELWSPA